MSDLNIIVRSKIDQSPEAVKALEVQIKQMSNQIKEALSVKLQIDAKQLEILTKQVEGVQQKIKSKTNTVMKDSLFINSKVEQQAFGEITARLREVKKNVDELASVKTRYSLDERGRNKLESADLTYYNKALGQTVTETMRWVETTKNVNGELQKTRTFRSVNLNIADDMAKAEKETKKFEQTLKDLNLYKQKMLGGNGFLGELDIFAKKQDGRYSESALTKIKSDVNALTASTPDLKNKIKQLNVEFGSLKQQAAESGSVLSRAVENAGKFLRFYLVGGFLVGIVGAFRSSVNYVMKLDNSLNQIRIVTNATQTEINKLAVSYNNLAKQMSVSTKDIATTAVDLFRQGLQGIDVEERMGAIIKYAKISSISLDKSNKILTATMNATGESAQKVIDIFSYLGDMTASGADEIGEALQRVASAAENSGISLEKSASWIATISSITRESASTIGRSINSIISRYESIKSKGFNEEDSTKINDVTEALSRVGIVATDIAGQLKPITEVVDSLGAKWVNLSKNEKAYIATTLFGTFQRNRGITLLNNYSDSLKNYEMALDSAGVADQKFSIYQESMAARLDTLTASWEGFISNAISSNFIKDMISGVSSLVEVMDKLINNSFSSFILQVGLMSTAIALLGKGFKTLKDSTLTYKAAQYVLMISSNGLIATMKALTASMLASPLFGVVVAVASIYGIAKAVDALTVSLEEQKEITQTLSSDIQKLQSEYDKLKSAENRTPQQEQYLSLLREELDIKNKLLTLESKKLVNKQFFTGQNDILSGFSDFAGLPANYTEATYGAGGAGEIRKSIDELKNLQSQLGNAGSVDAFNKINEKILMIKTSLIESRKEIQGYIDQFKKAGVELPPGLQELANNIDEVVINTKDLTSATDSNTDSTNTNTNAHDTQADSIDKLQDALSKSTNKLKDYNKYLAEMSSKEGLSIRSKEELMSKYSQFLPFLNDEIILRELIQNAIKEEEVVQSETYQNMIDSQIDLYTTQLMNSETYFTEIKKGNSDLWATLSQAYGSDLNNWNSLAKSKLETDNYLRQAIGEGWSELFGSQEDALIGLVTSMELSGNASNNPAYDAAYKQLNAIRGISDKIKSDFKTIDFGGINLGGIKDSGGGDSSKSAENKGKEIADELLKGYESRLNELSDDISLLGKIDTIEEKQIQSDILQKVGQVLSEQLIAVQSKIKEMQSEVSAATKEKAEELNSALEILTEKERKIRIDIVGNKEDIQNIFDDIQSEISDKAKDYFSQIQKNDELIRDSRISSLNAELDALEEKASIEDEIAQRMEKQLNLQKAQEQLSNVSKEKNVRLYTADKGWIWSSDPRAIAQANDQIESAQKDLLEFEKEIARKHQKEVVEKRIRDEELAFKNFWQNSEQKTAEYLNTLKKLYGDNWAKILFQLTSDIGSAKALFESLNKLQIIPPTILPNYQQPSTVGAIPNGVVSGNASGKPTVSVKAGSIDEAILKAQYGDSINIVNDSSGYVGVGRERTDTNQLYQNELAQYGLTPNNVGNLWNFGSGSSSGSSNPSTPSAPKKFQSFKSTLSHDSGGEAYGKGFMFKDIIEPERVLDPTQTKSFNKLVDMLPDLTRFMPRFTAQMPNFSFAGGGNDKSGDIFQIENLNLTDVNSPRELITQLKNISAVKR